MTYSVVFQFREPGQFPEERPQDEPIVLEKGESVPIPNVGDQVTYLYAGRPTAFRVVSRHFAYSGGTCTIKIEVASASAKQKALNLKE